VKDIIKMEQLQYCAQCRILLKWSLKCCVFCSVHCTGVDQYFASEFVHQHLNFTKCHFWQLWRTAVSYRLIVFNYQHLQHIGVSTHTRARANTHKQTRTHTHTQLSNIPRLTRSAWPLALNCHRWTQIFYVFQQPQTHKIIYRWSGTGCNSLPVINGHQIC